MSMAHASNRASNVNGAGRGKRAEGRGKRADKIDVLMTLIQSSPFGLMKLAKSLSCRSNSWSRARERVSSTRVAPSVRPS